MKSIQNVLSKSTRLLSEGYIIVYTFSEQRRKKDGIWIYKNDISFSFCWNKFKSISSRVYIRMNHLCCRIEYWMSNACEQHNTAIVRLFDKRFQATFSFAQMLCVRNVINRINKKTISRNDLSFMRVCLCWILPFSFGAPSAATLATSHAAIRGRLP